MAAALIWLAALELLGLVGLPFGWLLFRRHADLGYGTARALAALLFTYGVFLSGASGLSDRQRPALLAVASIVALAALALAYRQRAELERDLRAHAPALLRAELLFLVSWGLLLLPLLYTDTPRYGERAFDLAFLERLTLPGPLPPGNPYLSGEPLNYYYYGHLLYASMSTLLGLPATATYFLATATAGAMTIAATASLLSRLTPSRAGRCGALLLTCGAMNLAYVRDWSSGRTGDALAASNWMVGNAIDEYPLYAMVMAELHAHVMVMPAFVITIALCIALRDAAATRVGLTSVIASRRRSNLVGPSAESSVIPFATDRRGAEGSIPEPQIGSLRATQVWLAVCLALVAGSVGPTSTWSLITLGFVVIVLLVVQPITSALWRRTEPSAAHLAGATIAALAAGVVLYLPHYYAMRAVYPWPRLVGSLTSEPLGFCLHWELFLWLLGGVVISCATAAETARRAVSTHGEPAARARVATWAVVLVVIAAAAWIIVWAAGGASAIPSAVALLAVAVVARNATRPHAVDADCPEWRTAWTLIAVGWLIIAGCEIVHLDDYQSGPLERATTVFKFYMDAWLLLGLGAALPLAQLAALATAAEPRGRMAARLWGLVLLLALAIGAGYTALGVYAKTDSFRSGPHLSPLHFMDAVDPGYADGIRWLANLPNTAGQRRVVAEAIDPDRHTGWLSVAAPVDAYVAWPNLLVQWGYPPSEIRPRLDNLRRLYTLTEPSAACGLMTAEGIDFVFVGVKERRQFGPAVGAAFTQPPFRRLFVSGDSALFTCGTENSPQMNADERGSE